MTRETLETALGLEYSQLATSTTSRMAVSLQSLSMRLKVFESDLLDSENLLASTYLAKSSARR